MSSQHEGQNGHSTNPEFITSDQMYDPKSSEFVHHLFKIPVIADFHKYVSETKYGGIAVNAAGATFNTVSKITSPVQQRFQNQLNQVDALAGNSVKSLGDAVPAIMTPTNDILEKVKTPAFQTIDTVKQYGESISTTVTTPVIAVANSVSGELEQRVALPAKNLAQNVHAQITPVVKNVDRNFEPLVTKYATFVDSYISNEDEATDSENKNENDISQVYRALSVSSKVHRHLSRQVKERLNSSEHVRQYALLQKATETVNQLTTKLLGLVIYAKDNATSFKDSVQSPDLSVQIHARLHGIAGAILGEFDKGQDIPKAVQKRMIELSQTLVHTTDTIATYIKANAKNLPDSVQIRLQPMITFFNERYEQAIEEIKKEDSTAFQKAKNIAMVTSNEILPVLEKSLTDLTTSTRSSFSSTKEKVSEQLHNTARALGIQTF